ncbi:hypothetical protein CcCBS67573_g01997 [Chytriomyces confervae]|uniref:Uncharacterized protein n=1 Tax=Chytriomyces confervae TaxID=246404 RepID=A0A507FP17_9FUNG|nr:hypothetical protein HDU80_005801 [Chytriomyces hyalinus]TPX76767.1 hypothetical protein CcCBS67573_g01997 [Chytriomyces confervae]
MLRSLSLAPTASFSTKSALVTASNDHLLNFYRQPKSAVRLDEALLLDANVAQERKLKHLEQVMWTQFEHPEQAINYTLDTRDTWLLFHLRMVQLDESISYDLDMISKYAGIIRKTGSGGSGVGGSGGDLVLTLTMARKADEEICRRLSHACFKLWKISCVRDPAPDEIILARDIRAYARMLGLVHLKHAADLVAFID